MAVQVSIYSGNSEKAIRDLKKKMQRELVYRVMKMSRHYEKPSVERVRIKKETERRIRKNNRKRRLEM